MQISPGWQRAIGATSLIPAALALPVTAALLDDKMNENFLFPVSLGIAAGSGALAGATMPGMFGSGRSRLAGAAIGAGIATATSIAVDAALLFGLADRG
ncbi:MAG: hypothetical protein JWL76_1530 [Thermoleophilia bacterium]|nr:hypothetical protein [Thermoleophilia bacterium]